MDVTLRLNDLVEEFDGDARKALLAALAKIDMLQSRLAHLREANAWHPASEPPSDARKIEIKGLASYWYDGHPLSNAWGKVSVTHWRELPAPPDITSDMP